MLKSANLHKEFWGELREELPDLSKLNTIGSKSNYCVKEAKEQYNKMQKINSTVPQTIRVFSNFLKNILNDKDYAKFLISRS